MTKLKGIGFSVENVHFGWHAVYGRYPPDGNRKLSLVISFLSRCTCSFRAPPNLPLPTTTTAQQHCPNGLFTNHSPFRNYRVQRIVSKISPKFNFNLIFFFKFIKIQFSPFSPPASIRESGPSIFNLI